MKDDMRKKRITVCTPTYNRGYILVNLYESLKRQAFTDFEWLVIDDGSTDNTCSLIDKWQSENHSFLIRYHLQPNGGKHRAVNTGLDLANGEIFFVVDSDDYLTDDALEKLDQWILSIADEEKLKGVVANKGSSVKETQNPFFSEQYLDKTLLEMESYRENGKLVLGGERAIAFYTEFHRNYKYPEYENEKFLTEAVVYNRMAHDGYKMRFYNDIIWIFEYRKDGLSANGTDLYIKNPHGYGLWFKERADFRNDSFIQKWRMWYSFYCDLRDRCTVKEIAECIGAPVLAISACKSLFAVWHLINPVNRQS